MTHLVHGEGLPSSVCGDAHTGQSSVNDFVMTCCSRAQFLHM